jgi:hypothetical protein
MARCFLCNKKMGLMEFKCKCEKIYCLKCKSPELHNCTYNYKDNSKLNNKLIKVENQKIIKI